MDYQCLFPHYSSDHRRHGHFKHQRSRRDRKDASKDQPAGLDQDIRVVQTKHSDSSIVVEDVLIPSREFIHQDWETRDARQFASLRAFFPPPRGEGRDELGRLASYKPEAVNPFNADTFDQVVDMFHFHRACLRHAEMGQVSLLRGPGYISFYMETYSYRNGWYKVVVSYIPKTMTTTVYLHNFSASENETLASQILDSKLQSLNIHPIFVPLLVYELLFSACIRELYRIFDSSIRTQHSLGLNNNRAFRHFQEDQLDAKSAAQSALGDGQALAALEERFDFNIKAGRKLLTYFEEFDDATRQSEHYADFRTASGVIKHRLEYLVDGLEFQLPRLRRANTHTFLNRAGLESRTATTSNTLSYQIALESKADSTAMKAISLLTMFFLPATFVAAFFAMPLFDWQADQGTQVVNNRFWIYWAVTVPATLLVLSIWRIWWKFEEWRGARGMGSGQREGEGVWWSLGQWMGSWKRGGRVSGKIPRGEKDVAP